MDELAFRFETPNGKNRWDSPLFHLRPLEVVQPRRKVDAEGISLQDLVSTDAESHEEPKETTKYKYFPDTIVLEEINQALFHGVKPKPNMATAVVSTCLFPENSNFLTFTAAKAREYKFCS